MLTSARGTQGRKPGNHPDLKMRNTSRRYSLELKNITSNLRFLQHDVTSVTRLTERLYNVEA
jgi:hypothetical protein